MSNENIELNIDLESNVCEKLFDIIILLGPNDVDKINRQLEYNNT